ncbi:PilZ domain-containing protein [Aestuariivirga sp.]|uniref:PilZ domain-containing protein n=1 Tax=Aestuariivirga sp. TaxID=2650926 RepID=UPI0039E4D69B
MTHEAASERRAALRHKVLKTGKLILPHSNAVVDAVVTDISLTGARLQPPSGFPLPELFDLYLPDEAIRVASEVTWRAGDEVGIRFTAVARPFTLDERHGSAPSLLRSDNSNSGIPAAHRLANAPDPQSLHIHPDFRLGYEMHPLDSDRGDCLVEIHLTNNGEIGACHPFICLPSLGLHIVPAEGWDMREVTSVRRMLRIGQPSSAVLEQGASVHCCTVKLPFSSSDGGVLEYEVGSRHPLETLPDLRLTCTAGAGNYPTGRLPLIVPADVISNYLRDLSAEGRLPAEIAAAKR